MSYGKPWVRMEAQNAATAAYYPSGSHPAAQMRFVTSDAARTDALRLEAALSRVRELEEVAHAAASTLAIFEARQVQQQLKLIDLKAQDAALKSKEAAKIIAERPSSSLRPSSRRAQGHTQHARRIRRESIRTQHRQGAQGTQSQEERSRQTKLAKLAR